VQYSIAYTVLENRYERAACKARGENEGRAFVLHLPTAMRRRSAYMQVVCGCPECLKLPEADRRMAASKFEAHAGKPSHRNWKLSCKIMADPSTAGAPNVSLKSLVPQILTHRKITSAVHTSSDLSTNITTIYHVYHTIQKILSETLLDETKPLFIPVSRPLLSGKHVCCVLAQDL